MSGTKEKIYRYTRQRLLEGDPPSIREVQRAMQLKAVESARAHLEALVAEGRLVKRNARSRPYALPPQERLSQRHQKVPVLGTVQAGALTAAFQDIESYVEIERSLHGEELFALRVRGQSMKDVGILPGDLVIARRQASADDGDIVIAMVDSEATVKVLKRRGEKVVLEARNPNFEDIEIKAAELTLLGKVLELRRVL